MTFNRAPVAWLEDHKLPDDLGRAMFGLAAAAVNAGDMAFGRNLNAMLGHASADQGRAVGAALASLAPSCADVRDPADVLDKRYISQIILSNLLSNESADIAFAQASGPRTASTRVPGAPEAGAGPVFDTLPSGGRNTGAEPVSTTWTANRARPEESPAVAAIGESIVPFTSATTTLVGDTGSGAVSGNE